MSESRPPVNVLILGKEYPVVCPDNEEHELLLAARYLDGKMRKIRDTGRVIGTERIAVMAALNIAHELTQLRRENKELAGELGNRVSAMHDRIDSALNEE
ncbi:cell division protein ZapA [Methylococcus sp. EFPC2]|uniref:cell division protein ZapA n=1 Tax=Methylococcus sp. EFPC2 TaxID=2812648 RepID=UPI0019674C1C|nr:cell division protein ZapA [Methylococcus sp. EFPC2]QSA96675.1 cell division protein ZapA [Methylococcus sp. EFPC2]